MPSDGYSEVTLRLALAEGLEVCDALGFQPGFCNSMYIYYISPVERCSGHVMHSTLLLSHGIDGMLLDHRQVAGASFRCKMSDELKDACRSLGR